MNNNTTGCRATYTRCRGSSGRVCGAFSSGDDDDGANDVAKKERKNQLRGVGKTNE